MFQVLFDRDVKCTYSQHRPMLVNAAASLSDIRAKLIQVEHRVSEIGWKGWARAATEGSASKAYQYVKRDLLPCVRLVDNHDPTECGDRAFKTCAASSILEEALCKWDGYWTAPSPQVDHTLWPEFLWTRVELISVFDLRKCARSLNPRRHASMDGIRATLGGCPPLVWSVCRCCLVCWKGQDLGLVINPTC